MIGPAKARLSLYLSEAEGLLAREKSMEVKEKLRELLLRISKAVNLLEEQNARWSDLMARIVEGDRLETENAEYERATTGREGFTAIMEKGRECADMIEFTLQPGSQATSAAVSIADGQAGGGQGQGQGQNWGQGLLPRASLPKFGGDPRKYRAYRQMVEALVLNTGAPGIIKLTQVLGTLEGDALEAVSGYPPEESSLPLVLDVLERRYGDKKLFVETLLGEMLALQPANDSAPSVRTLSETVERICRQLPEADSADNLFVSATVKSKLPERWLKELIRREHAGGARWTTKELRDHIQRVLAEEEELNRVCRKGASTPKQPTHRVTQPERRGGRHRDDAVEKTRAFPVVKGNGQGRVKSCFLQCGVAGHWAADCRKYPNTGSRERRAKELKLCFRCLRPGHGSKECTWKCRRCGQDHLCLVFGRKSPSIGTTRQEQPQWRENHGRGCYHR